MILLHLFCVLTAGTVNSEYDEIFNNILQLYNQLSPFNDNYFKSINFSKLISVHDDLLSYITLRQQKLIEFINATKIDVAMKCSEPWTYRETLNVNYSTPHTDVGFLYRNISQIQQIYFQQPSDRINSESEECSDVFTKLIKLRESISQGYKNSANSISEEVIMIDQLFNVFKFPGNKFLEVQDSYSVIGKNLFPKLKKVVILYYNPYNNRYSNQMFQVIFDELILLLQDKTIIEVNQINQQEIIQLYNGTVMDFALISNKQIFMNGFFANQIDDDLMSKIKQLYNQNNDNHTLQLLLTNYKSEKLLTYLSNEITVVFFNYTLPFYRPNQTQQRLTQKQYQHIVNFQQQFHNMHDFKPNKNIKIYQINNIENANNKLIQFQIKRLVFQLMQQYIVTNIIQTPITLLTNNFQNELAIYLMQAVFDKDDNNQNVFKGIIAISVRTLPLIRSLNKQYQNIDTGQQLYQLGEELQFNLDQSPMVYSVFNTMRNSQANLLLQKSDLIYQQLKVKYGELLFRLPYYLQQSYSGASLENVKLNFISLGKTFNYTENISNSNYIFPAIEQYVYYIAPYGSQEQTKINLPKQKNFVQVSTNKTNYGVLQYFTDEQFANSSQFQLLYNYDYTKSTVYNFNDCNTYKAQTQSDNCLDVVDQFVTMHVNIKYFSVFDAQGTLLTQLRYIIQDDLQQGFNNLKISQFENLTCQNNTQLDYCEFKFAEKYTLRYPKRLIFHLNLLKYMYQQTILSSRLQQETEYCISNMILDIKICQKLFSNQQEVFVYNHHFHNIDFLGRTKKLDFTLSNATANLKGCGRQIYNRYQMNQNMPSVFTDKYLFIQDAKVFTISNYLHIHQLYQYKILYDQRNDFPVVMLTKNYIGEDQITNDIFDIFQENNLVGVQYIDYIEFNAFLEILNTNQYSFRDAKYNYSDNNMLDNTRCNGDNWYSFRLLELLYQIRFTNISYSRDGEKFCMLPSLNVNLTEENNYTVNFTINHTIFYITKYLTKDIYRMYSPNISMLVFINKRVSDLCFSTFKLLTDYADKVLALGIRGIEEYIDFIEREQFYYYHNNTDIIIDSNVFSKQKQTVQFQSQLIQYLTLLIIGLSIALTLIRYTYL